MVNYNPDQSGLRPWKSGEQPKGGRPKGGISIVEELRKLINKEFEMKNSKGEKEKKTGGEWISTMLMAKALRGEDKALREVMDRIEGKPLQKVESKTSFDFGKADLSGLSDEALTKLIEDNTEKEGE